MSTMRPFQIIVISLFAVAALGGLLLFATFKGFGGAKPVGPVVIWGTLPADAVLPAIDELKRVHEEFKSVTYEERDGATFDTDLADALAAGSGPDVIMTNQEWLRAETNKLSVIPFSEISERTLRDSYLPIYDIFLTEGGTYGIPFAVDPLVLYYNRSRLASANIPQVPTSWEGIVGVTPNLTTRTDAGAIGKSALPLGTYENVDNARGILSLLLLQSGNAVSEKSTGQLRSTLASGQNTASGVSAAESSISFYTQFADPAKMVYTWNRSLPDSHDAFIAGDSAFYLGYASQRVFIASANPNLDFDIAPVPQPETATTKVNYALAYAFAIPKGSGNPTGALRVARALASVELAPQLLDNLGMAPAARALLSPAKADIDTPIVYPQALIARGWLSPAPAVTDRIFAAMITAIISGRMSVHDALTTADQSLTAALR